TRRRDFALHSPCYTVIPVPKASTAAFPWAVPLHLPKEVRVSAPAPVVTSNGTNERPHKPIPVFENSPTFQMACKQLQSVAEHMTLDNGVLERLSKPKRAMVVSIPIRMDSDGRTESFIGFRVQHSLTSGPSKGG